MAFAAGDYYEIRVTVEPGYKADFSSLTAALVRGIDGPPNTELRSDRSGTTSLGNHTVGASPAQYTYSSNFAGNLSNATGTVLFYLIGWTAGNDSDVLTVGEFSGDDLVVSGTVSLPVSLLHFDARIKGDQVQLDFSTVSESNNAYFDVERSTDGLRFEPIGRIDGAGNSTVVLEYTFTDAQPQLGTNYYRLRQVDFDGSYTYSPVATAVLGTASRLSLMPNPAADELLVALADWPSEEVAWEVFDQSGKRVLQGFGAVDGENLRIPVAQLPKGVYLFRLQSDRTVVSERFLVK